MISEQIVKEFGGKINLNSVVGKGTTFSFNIIIPENSTQSKNVISPGNKENRNNRDVQNEFLY